MPKFYINWEARGVQGYDTIEAESLEAARKEAYRLAKEDFENSVDYVAKPIAQAIAEGDVEEENEEE